MVDSRLGLVEDTLAEGSLVLARSLVVDILGVEGSPDVAVGNQDSRDHTEAPQDLLDDLACTCGVGPSADQGSPGALQVLLPLNCSCLDRCLHLPRLLAWEASRLLLPPCRKVLKKVVLSTRLDLFFNNWLNIGCVGVRGGLKNLASPWL